MKLKKEQIERIIESLKSHEFEGDDVIFDHATEKGYLRVHSTFLLDDDQLEGLVKE